MADTVRRRSLKWGNSMKPWEYKKIALREVSRRRDEIDLLCEAGDVGWKLVAVLPNGVGGT
jgi:hypothetical protein